MKLLGGHQQTTERSWKPAKRPRINRETTICLLTQAVRDPELLKKGLETIKKTCPDMPRSEHNKIIEAALKNGRLDPNKHPESYALLKDFYAEINNGAQLPAYTL